LSSINWAESEGLKKEREREREKEREREREKDKKRVRERGREQLHMQRGGNIGRGEFK
jgi:hypothetical protein